MHIIEVNFFYICKANENFCIHYNKLKNIVTFKISISAEHVIFLFSLMLWTLSLVSYVFLFLH